MEGLPPTRRIQEPWFFEFHEDGKINPDSPSPQSTLMYKGCGIKAAKETREGEFWDGRLTGYSKNSGPLGDNKSGLELSNQEAHMDDSKD
ncbi:hypothetical protein O181_000508 [Austropuccinia psidii MF-1]|uniref:Uncharacterized protein n=1 Tax=Austropuccinia psidii MF-1 TaxID=1389203 RepID=A0A9Q3GAX8_9BASI|nr:hypothetical protein [Austropuccinia psidii MF-1]